jgi:mRNA interferase MazF
MTPPMISRGDLITVSAPGDFGKPRPAVVIQADVLTEAGVNTVLVCLISSHIVTGARFRLTVEPDSGNGLVRTSQIMADKIISLPRGRIGRLIGRLDADHMQRLNRTLAFVVGLG